MKIGIDIHGTIDRFPKFFSILTRILRIIKVEIHITTGVEKKFALKELKRMKIEYDYLFSITEYHKKIGTKILWDEFNLTGDGMTHPLISNSLWNRTKGNYCKINKIDLHIDDSPVYGRYFSTPYINFSKVFRKNADKIEVGKKEIKWPQKI